MSFLQQALEQLFRGREAQAYREVQEDQAEVHPHGQPLRQAQGAPADQVAEGMRNRGPGGPRKPFKKGFGKGF